jgi:hypothetical protein
MRTIISTSEGDLLQLYQVPRRPPYIRRVSSEGVVPSRSGEHVSANGSSGRARRARECDRNKTKQGELEETPAARYPRTLLSEALS